MAFLDKAIDFICKEERKIKRPEFIKEFSKQDKQLEDLMQISNKINDGRKKDMILRDIAFLKKGIEGEDKVCFELKNSFLPILCLHDIRLEYKDYIAQYDFIVISSKFICVLETKSLNGNIEIDPNGNFIRIILDKSGREIRREGIYSPIVQNERHLNILKEILKENNLLNEMLYLSYIVMANPKSIIHKEKCSPEISNLVIKHDQIINTLTHHQNNSMFHKLEKYLTDISDWLKNNHKPLEIDYHAKYKLTASDFINTINVISTKEQLEPFAINKKNVEQLREELKKYRLAKSKEENVPAYMIFNNEEMERLVLSYPTTENELLAVKGFGKKKIDKYGKELIKIFTAN